MPVGATGKPLFALNLTVCCAFANDAPSASAATPTILTIDCMDPPNASSGHDANSEPRDALRRHVVVLEHERRIREAVGLALHEEAGYPLGRARNELAAPCAVGIARRIE